MDRGDDAAGPLTIAAIRARLGDDPDVELAASSPSNLMDLLRDRQNVILIDACVDGTLSPGEVIETLEVPDERSLPSTHGLSISSVIRCAEALGFRPRSLHLVLIVGSRFDAGSPISTAVEQGVQHAATRVLDRISAMRAA